MLFPNPNLEAERAPRGLVALCCFVFFSNIIQFGVFRDFPLFQLSVFLLALFICFFRRVFIDSLLLIVIGFVFFVCIFALLLNFNAYNFLAYSFFCFSVVVVYGVGAKYNNYGIASFLGLFVAMSLAFMIFSLSEGFSIYRFSGFFDNPNGMGRFAAWTMLISLLSILVLPNYCKSKVSVTFFVFTASLSCVLLLASNSRLSIGSLVFSFLATSLLYIFRRVLLLSFRRSSLYKAFWGLLLFFCLTFVLYKFGFFDDLIFKFASTLDSGDFTQGRTARWEDALPYLSLFGQGHDIYSRSGLSEVHSNYIGQVLVFGWISAIAIYTLIFFMFFKSMYCFLASGFYGYIMAFALFCFYFFYSLFETGFAILPIYLAIFFLGFSDSLLKTNKNKADSI